MSSTLTCQIVKFIPHVLYFNIFNTSNCSSVLKIGFKSYALQWYEKFTDVDEVIPVSAKYGHGVEDIKDWILSKLPTGPPYYPKVCRNSTYMSVILFLFNLSSRKKNGGNTCYLECYLKLIKYLNLFNIKVMI